MRSFLVGLYSGFLLSALRAPLGLEELLQLPAADPHATLALRAAALLAVAVGSLFALHKAPERFSPVVMLVGVAVGFSAQWMIADQTSQLAVGVTFSVLLVLVIAAGHRGGADTRPDKLRIVLSAIAALVGWLLIRHGTPQSHAGAVLVTLAGAAAIALVGWLSTQPAENDAPSEKPAVGRAAALVVSGAGLALMCEGLARPLRQLGAGLASDDHVFGSLFLLLAAFGAIAFGRLFNSEKARELGRAALLVGAWGAAFVAASLVSNISTVRGLDRLVRRFGLDLSLHGMWSYDAVISAPVFVLPAFLVGTLIALCKRPTEVVSLCVGAAAGMILVPGRLSYEVAELGEITQIGSHSTALALSGAAIAALSAAISAASAGAASVKSRALVAVLGLGCCVGAWSTSRSAQLVRSSRPWERRPPIPTLFLDTAAGVLTIENSPAANPIASLNGHALAPPRESSASDIARLQLSWSLLPEGLSNPRLLLVGQLTPERAECLQRLGAARIDRSATWHGAMALLEERLFGAQPVLAGEILEPRVARAKLHAGEYDLVIVPPIAGALATTRNLASPSETTVVAWFDGASGAQSLTLGDQVILAAPDLRTLYLAVARGPGVAASQARRVTGSPAWFVAGHPEAQLPALEALQLRAYARGHHNLSRLAARLAQAELAPGLGAALALHFEAQKLDSPFESWEVATELEDEVLYAIGRSAAGEAPSSLAVEAIEALARILLGKRRIDMLYPTLEPVLERHSPWPTLELALAQADLELLDPQACVERLVALFRSWSPTPDVLAMLAEAQQQVGDEQGAAESLERALALAPGQHALERRHAIALMRAGRPEGPAALQRVLLEDPEDEELLQYTSPGPWKPVRAGYHALQEHVH